MIILATTLWIISVIIRKRITIIIYHKPTMKEGWRGRGREEGGERRKGQEDYKNDKIDESDISANICMKYINNNQ